MQDQGKLRMEELVDQTLDHYKFLGRRQRAAMAMEPDGPLRFGPLGGASHYDLDTGDRQTFATADGLAHNYVEAITVGPDGDLWFGTMSGVSRFEPTSP